MKVRMRTTAAGPNGVLMTGKIYDLPGEFSRQLVNGGFAEIVGKKESVVEATNFEPAKETTTMPTKPKPRGRGRGKDRKGPDKA